MGEGEKRRKWGLMLRKVQIREKMNNNRREEKMERMTVKRGMSVNKEGE